MSPRRSRSQKRRYPKGETGRHFTLPVFIWSHMVLDLPSESHLAYQFPPKFVPISFSFFSEQSTAAIKVLRQSSLVTLFGDLWFWTLKTNNSHNNCPFFLCAVRVLCLSHLKSRLLTWSCVVLDPTPQRPKSLLQKSALLTVLRADLL